MHLERYPKSSKIKDITENPDFGLIFRLFRWRYLYIDSDLLVCCWVSRAVNACLTALAAFLMAV